MRRAGIFAALLAVLLTACGGGKASPEPVLEINGVSIGCDTEVNSILNTLDALDGTCEYAEAISCVYDGMDKTYSYADAVVYTYPDGGGDKLMELSCSGGGVQTPAGISLGDTRDKIIQTYGGSFSEAGTILSYEEAPSTPEMEPASLYFELSDGKVCAIGITAEHRKE